MKFECKTIDISAIAAISWITALSVHIGVGYGIPCRLLGGKITSWSSFSLICTKSSNYLEHWGFVCACVVISNLILLVVSWVLWCRLHGNTSRFLAWAMFIVNGFLSFAYLIMSSYWSDTGFLIGSELTGFQILLSIVGLLGYILVIKLGASMLSTMLTGLEVERSGWKIVNTIWVTTGIISTCAAVISPINSAQMFFKLLGLTLITNVGLLFIPKLLSNSIDRQVPLLHDSKNIVDYAIVIVTAFILVLGPGIIF